MKQKHPCSICTVSAVRGAKASKCNAETTKESLPKCEHSQIPVERRAQAPMKLTEGHCHCVEAARQVTTPKASFFGVDD